MRGIRLVALVLVALAFGVLIGRAADSEARSQYPPNCQVFEDGSALCHVDD